MTARSVPPDSKPDQASGKTPEASGTSASETAPLRWTWVGAGAVIGALLFSLFVYVVDPGLERTDVVSLVFVLSVILVGILVGYRSPGETIREAALSGVALLALVAIVAVGFLGIEVPAFVWLISPFFTAAVALAGGWVGEILQGTLEEAYEDRAVDWPWVFVSIVIGVTLSAYAVFLGEALFDISDEQSLYVFASSFLVTGWLVGFLSPGFTMVEPAIAALLMITIDAAFVIMWFGDLAGTQVFLIGFAAGTALALLGGWLGEMTQRLRKKASGRT